MSAAGRRRPELSQHFLRRRELASRLVAAAALGPHDLVVEVGPGRGVLTEALVATGARVLAVEVDPDLARLVADRFAARVESVQADFLDFPIPRGARLIANLPFSITADAIRHVVRSEAQDAHFIVQREAAERFAGAPWGRETLASLELKPWWHTELLRPLRRTDFDPPPSVDCAYLWLARRTPPLLPLAERAPYRSFFARTIGRGRTLREALRREFTRPQLDHITRDLGLPIDAHPTAATFDQWLAIYRASVRLRAEGR